MSIYKKISDIQQKLMKRKFETKHGFHGDYIPLPEMLPPILDECFNKELTLYFTSTTEHLMLKLMAWDGKEEFSVRVRLPELTREEKDEGKKITYLKRYLLMNTFMIIEDAVDPDDLPENDNNASSAKHEKEEGVVEEVKNTLDLEALYNNALKTLRGKSVEDKDITHAAIRKQIFKDGDFKSKSERNDIAKYCKETWGASK